MASPDAIGPAPILLEGNSPLVLDGASAWHVQAGAVALFRTIPRGEDFDRGGYLVGVDTGTTIFWLPTADAPPVMVIAIEPATLVRTPMTQVLEAVAAGDAHVVQAAKAWAHVLGSRHSTTDPAATPALAHVTVEEAATWLSAVQHAFIDAANQADRARADASEARFHERQRVNERVTADTLDVLTRIGARPVDAPAAQGQDAPVVAVLRQVGEACGISVRVPASSPRGLTLDAVLDASGARKRKVLLSGRWWAHDGEPMMATIAATGEPVGLVPVRRGGFVGVQYRAFFATIAARDVDATLADAIASSAVALQPPLEPPLTARRIVAWTLRGRGPEFGTAIVSGIAIVLLGMAVPQATKILFEFAIPDADRYALLELGLAVLAATIGGAVFDLARGLALLRLAAGAAARLQLGVWDRLLDQSPTFFRKFTAGDLDSRVSAITQIRGLLCVTAFGTLISGVATLLNIPLLFTYSPALTLAAIVIAVVLVGVSIFTSLTVRRLLGPLQEREGQLRGLVIQLLGAVSKLRTAGAESRAFAQWGRIYAAKMQLAQRLRSVADRSRLVTVLVTPLGTATLFWIAADDVFGPTPSITIGAFVAFSAAFGAFLAGVTSLSDNAQMLLQVSALWNRLRPILDTEPELQAQRNPPGRLTGRIRLDHVTFRYRADGPLTLDDVSIQAEAGECIALVGPSGSGKSTLVNLLLRFESPSSGAVYFDDHDLKGLDILAVRQQLGVVSQENKILAGSIFENISVGSLEATHDDAWAAAKAAGIEEEIRQMPMGLHTFVAEGGANLSGGQRQRLLIARVLLRKPSLLILDEATSALDNRSQAIVTDSLNRLKTTRILIAHRLSTIRQADRIYVIEAGRVVQHGTFEALMREEGLFAKLMRRQVA